MATGRNGGRRISAAHPWWRPVVYSAVATAAIAAVFNPVPALADPATAETGAAVPDVGSRPTAVGTLTIPGQTSTSTTTTATSTIAGSASSPVLQKIEKGRAEVAAMGDDLIQAGQDRDLAKTQYEAAEKRYTEAADTLQDARDATADAATQSMIDAAAALPGTYDTGLSGLDDLARLQRGDVDTEQATARQVGSAEIAVQLALDEQTLAKDKWDDLVAKYNKLSTDLNKKEAAQQALELAHADELAAAESSSSATDSALGAQYLAGAEAGRGADPRAIQALEYALAQRGDPYVWSEEGPDEYDCSGLMYAAYRSVGFQLTRVSRDQYWQTRNKVVDRYSLLPGDLLFFSDSNSWHGIHHVAMYAGDGMMVEAPRTGLNVRLVSVRWSQLFQATRVYGSVEGVTEGPELGSADPDPTTTTTSPTTSPTTTKPTTTSPTTKPTTSPTSKPTTTSPSTTTSTPEPTTEPTTTEPTTTAPSSEGSGSGSSSSGAATSTSSANAIEEATQSASSSSEK